ncbi:MULTISPECIES: hypothetical protein [Streptomyces]|uniref:hypothetical protein n=1 Tax=Streptomyces TaxID=1883 RepID=UPI001431C07D|nr:MULTISPECIES: hypothetical protein [Streptomyces]
MEWTDPRYATVAARYQAEKAAAPAPRKRHGLMRDRAYGDPFLVFVDPATLKPYTVAR